MEDPIVEVETRIAADPQAVWAAMTSRHSPMFMGATMETDWTPGSRYTLSGEWGGNSFTDYGEIVTADPGRELSFTHWPSTPEPPESFHLVRVRIAPDGEGSMVKLAQFGRGQPQEADDETKAEYRKNWTMMLDGLRQAAEKR
jgi:uncharacterized protein YndB with AHSA1/START domain